MEIEGEIIGFVLVFLIISGAFYFFVFYDRNSEDSATEIPDQIDEVTNSSENSGGDIVNSTNSTLNQTLNQTIPMNFSEIVEVHWDHMPLRYKFVNDYGECQGAAISKLVEAFEIVTEKTGNLVNFTEVSGDQIADINITCSNLNEILEELDDDERCENVSLDYRSIELSGYEFVEENEYVTFFKLLSRNDTTDNFKLCYVNKNSATSNYSMKLLDEASVFSQGGVIKGGYKNIYTADSFVNYCKNFPAREVQEVLHLLGIKHSEVPEFDDYYGWYFKDLRYFKDVMFPYTYCIYVTEINQNYIDCLKYIYSNGEAASGCAGVNFVS